MQDKPKRTKRAVNLSIDADLVAEAREHGTNMSALLEKALREELREGRERKWREENRTANETYNDYVRKHGRLSDDWRKF